jgi:1-acyl-sn-glycerol-3-phosphate acyltransferase
MRLFNQLVGTVTIAIFGTFFFVGDIAGRLIVVPLVWMLPRHRAAILRRWVLFGRDFIMATLRTVGRARFDIQPRIPCQGGILIVANHQSLVDIPVVYSCVLDGYPRMVSHARYGRGVPLVSLTMKLCGGILVQPGRTGRAELEALRETASSAVHPIVIFPEGHRTRDGEIRTWKRAGLENFLSARAWTVHVIVIDGLWRAARITDFIRTIATVRCRAESAGTFAYDGRGRANHDEFIDRIERAMCAKLSEMRVRGDARSESRSSEGAVT